MKSRRMAAVLAAAAASVLLLAGCTGGGSETGSSESSGSGEIQSGTSVSVAENGAVTSFNGNTATGYSTYNTNVGYMFSSSFNYYDATPKLVKNTKFGTYQKLSDDPLTIKYTVAPGVTWSDGVPVNASDMLLAWAANQSKWNDPKGVNFASIGAGTGSGLVTAMPKISDGGRSLTLVYPKPYVDWEVSFGIGVPAHTTWEVSGAGAQKGAAAQKALIAAIQDDDTAALTKVAKTWATGYNATSLPSDKRLLVSNGPYTVTSFVKDQYITLTARKGYKAGPQPHIQKITVRFIADQTAQVQALQNGEVSVLYGQATADTVKALKAVKNAKSTTSANASYEHIDLTFNNGGPFSPKAYGGDAAKALEVRQAFFKVIPRQEMVDRLIKPLQSDAKVDGSALFLPGQKGYTDAAAAYNTVDVAGAKQLLQEAGVKTPVTVRFAYATDNPRRAGEFQLLQASAKQAGFNVTDVGKPTSEFFDPEVGIGTGKYDYDATVFAYSSTAIAATQSQANTTTGNAYNYQGYSNKEVDAAWKRIESASDFDAAIPDLQSIDKELIADASNISLFQLPDVSAWDANLSNVQDAPLVPNIYWNFFDWKQTKSSTK